jgi:hypothetical protein
VLVTLGGTALLVLPGPAFAIIPVGLFMLAMEFAWAERALHKAIVRAEDARRKAAATSTLQRVLAGVATALAVCAAVTAVLLWNIPVLPG